MRPIFPARLKPQLPSLVRKPEPSIRSKLVYNNQSPATPIHLSASTVLKSGSSGTVNAAALKNPMGQAMELLEIKFELSADWVGEAAPALGGTISCELMLGKLKLTNAAIPVWGFGRAENLSGESKSNTASQRGFLSYSWRLPRPLYIPAGEVVTPNFVHSGDIPDSVNVRIGYSARTVFTKPKIVYVPWVAKFVSKSFNPLEDAGVDQSGELDLVNPHAEPLHLQRFTGRTLALILTASDAVRPTSENLPQSLGAQYLSMRMTDSYGRPIVRSFTPFRSVFSALTRSWEMDNGAMLDPESYYVVNLKKEAMVLAAAAEGSYAQAHITMVGWRELTNS